MDLQPTSLRKRSRTLAVCIFLILIAGCNSAGSRISARLSVPEYVKARKLADPRLQSKTFYFPTLEVYVDSGAAVYSGHDPVMNGRILQNFPDSIKDLHPMADGPRLQKILEEIPDFKTREQAILGKRFVVLSILLEQCPGCSVQEEALDEVKYRLQDVGVVFLQVNLAHP